MCAGHANGIFISSSVESFELVFITFAIIGRDFEDFHKLSLSPDPRNMKQQVDRIRDVAPDSSVR